jgi:hypothetical protein
MKLALRYGLIVTAGVIVWTLTAHALIPNPQSAVHTFGAFTFFNLLHFAGIYLGIRALERELHEKPTFKEGLKQGVQISVVYALAAALFFAITLLIVGTKWMAAEATTAGEPIWVVGVKAFAGLTLMTIFFGIIYSTLISFFLARRLAADNDH